MAFWTAFAHALAAAASPSPSRSPHQARASSALTLMHGLRFTSFDRKRRGAALGTFCCKSTMSKVQPHSFDLYMTLYMERIKSACSTLTSPTASAATLKIEAASSLLAVNMSNACKSASEI